MVATRPSTSFRYKVARTFIHQSIRRSSKPWMVEMKNSDWSVMLEGQKIAHVDKGNFSFSFGGQIVKFDYAYIIIHGTPGEDGILQGYFDLMKIPYSTCGVHSSALTFNKYFCSNYLRNFDIPMAQVGPHDEGNQN